MLRIVQGDITKLKVDVVVNAANNELNGGGGVDGAIHSAAGPELLTECLSLGGCQTGKAKLTKGYRLFAKHIIHTVGPVWYGGSSREESYLRSCYKESFLLFEQLSARSIAFPAISTGVYGYPFEPATRMAFFEARMFLQSEKSGEREVIFVYFSEKDHQVANKLYRDYFKD